MRKGLITLMTVAIALVGVKAMAMAPIIGDIPNPVVGDQTAATQPTPFVFIDAFNLDDYVSDPEGTADSALKWTYEIVASPVKYNINGIAPINSTTTDPTSPSLAVTINKTVTGETNTDAKPETITIRNINLRPFSGTGATPPASGFTDTQAVTFFASDGNAYSSSTVLFYTKIGSMSYLSSRNPFQNVKSEAFATFPNQGPSAQRWTVSDGPFGGVTTATWTGTPGKGLCFNVAAAGDNIMAMASPNPYFSLTANTVYRIRARMNCSQATGGATPFWDFIVENTMLNAYGFDAYFMDNERSANAVLNTSGGTWVTMYWAPAAMRTAQWNDATNGIFKASLDATNDPRVRFRVLDTASNGALLAGAKSGLICLQELIVESVPLSRLNVKTANVVNITSLAAANAAGTGNVSTSSFVATVVAYNAGVMTVTPTAGASGGAANEIVTIVPRTDSDAPTAPALYQPSEWPIAWATGKVYELQVSVAAPDANGQSHPWDVIWLSMEPPTNELNTESYVTATGSLGSPRTGTAQVYSMFYSTGNETASTTSAFHFLRWRVRFGNSASLQFPSNTGTDAGGANIGGASVSKIVVNEVSFN